MEPHEHAIMYRLGEYKLIEYDSVLLWWEKHAALGEQCRGRCFILGDVLIIGHQISRETGYLIGEFLEQLEKFPKSQAAVNKFQNIEQLFAEYPKTSLLRNITFFPLNFNCPLNS